MNLAKPMTQAKISVLLLFLLPPCFFVMSSLAGERFGAEIMLDGSFFQLSQSDTPYALTGTQRSFNGQGILLASFKINSSLALYYEGRYNQFEPLNYRDQLPSHGYGYPVLQGFLRYNTKLPGSLTIQIGKFGSPFGHFLTRNYPNQNPLVSSPLIYTHNTTIRSDRVPSEAYDLVRWQYKDAYLPYSYAREYGGIPVLDYPYSTGIMASGEWAKIDYRLAAVNSSLANPLNIGNQGQRLQWVAGAGISPFQGLRLGSSFAEGPYLDGQVRASLPNGLQISDFHQKTLAFELQYSLNHLEIQSELVFNTFQVPNIYKPVGTTGYYLEAKQTLSPRIYAAARWDQIISDRLATNYNDYYDSDSRFDSNVNGLEVTMGYRISEKLLLKSSYLYRHTNGVFTYHNHGVSLQLVYVFDVDKLLRLP